MTLIYCVPKSPHQKGRRGSAKSQDWWIALAYAVKIAQQVEKPMFLVYTGFHADRDESEADLYLRALRFAAPDISVLVYRKGVETVGHVEGARTVARQMGEKIIFVPTRLHYWRVRGLLPGEDVRRPLQWGQMRPREVFTDLVLTGVFPVIDKLGLRSVFLEMTIGRREKGNF